MKLKCEYNQHININKWNKKQNVIEKSKIKAGSLKS